MPKITISRDKCKGCFLCVGVCPQGLIIADKGLNLLGIKPVKFSRQINLKEGGMPAKTGKSGKDCIGCSLCTIICPDCCIEVYK